ncbi:hypothetical protein F383_11902 [Gossypium arboreum]|uniref:Uncharacterized protein n=1 Tax=Gossypium arboreum TaxID=29729 RepID=A0A0B0NG46_GOSAR|nr:hypothetical protein F383_11902 [Gossypium arboreum]
MFRSRPKEIGFESGEN